MSFEGSGERRGPEKNPCGFHLTPNKPGLILFLGGHATPNEEIETWPQLCKSPTTL